MAANISEDRILKILNAVDSLGNLQLLLGRENVERSNKEFFDWIHTREDEFLEEHLIPRNSNLWNVNSLPEFVAQRGKLIRQRLRPGLAQFPADHQSEAVASLGE